MSRCCTLANPSSDPVILHAQKGKLKALCVPDQLPDHVCVSKVSVNYDRYNELVNTLPLNFCIRVIINVDQQVHSQLPDMDPVAKAIYDQYITDSCAVAVMETSSELDTVDLKESAKALGRSTVVVFHTPASASASASADGIKHVRYVDPEHILAIMAHSSAHILTGHSISWNAAVMSQSDLVAYPDPWVPGYQPNGEIKSQWIKVSCHWNYTRYFSHAYYINLDRRPDRRAHMEQQLDRFGLVATRIPAIDGKTLSWKAEYGIISEYWNHGAFAYCISYRSAIIDAIRKGYDNILIMDDDCKFQDNLWNVLDKCWKLLPDEWHMLYLAANHGAPHLGVTPVDSIPASGADECLYRLRGSMGSHAIIINKVCFYTILNYLSAPYAPLDMFFGMYQKFFPCYITYPGLATQLSGVSDILGKSIDYTKDWGVDYVDHIKK